MSCARNLMADGGNVEIVEIDGPIVKVRPPGVPAAPCPSSTMNPGRWGIGAQAA